jgi:hypothetical protein
VSKELKSRLNEAFRSEEKGDLGRAADCFLEAASLVSGKDGVPNEVLADHALLCRWVVGCFVPCDYGFASGYHVESRIDPMVAGLKLASVLPDPDGEIDFWRRYFEDLALGIPIQKNELQGQGLHLYRAIYESSEGDGLRILECWGEGAAIRTSQLRGYVVRR